MNTENNDDDKVKVTSPADEQGGKNGAEVTVEPPEDQGSEPAAAEPPPAEPGEPQKPASGGGGAFRVLVVLLLLLLIGGIAAGGWFGWQWLERELDRYAGQSDALQQQAAQLERLESRLDRVAETRASRERLDALRDDLSAEQRNLREEVRALAGDMQSLREAARGGQRDLALSEIEYLLRIAADSLYLANDVDTAIYALQTADNRLRRLGEPRLNPVRQLITDHLQDLNALNMPDTQGMAMKLGSMMRQVSELPLSQTQHARTTAQAGDTTEPERNWWERLRGGMERVFRKLVVVERAEPPAPLLTPEQHFFLYRNVEMQLSAARAALLAGDAASYRQSLQLAREWLDRYFDTGEPAVANAIADISGLLEVPLQPDLPDINPALERFRSLTDSSGVLQGARTG